ncbi:MAG: YdcF family protein, partial [Pseudomonadota bacterium]
MGDVFFAASKIFWALAAPSTALVLIIALGALALLFGRTRVALLLILPGALLLFIAAHTPLGEGLLAPLETRFERP